MSAWWWDFLDSGTAVATVLALLPLAIAGIVVRRRARGRLKDITAAAAAHTRGAMVLVEGTWQLGGFVDSAAGAVRVHDAVVDLAAGTPVVVYGTCLGDEPDARSVSSGSSYRGDARVSVVDVARPVGWVRPAASAGALTRRTRRQALVGAGLFALSIVAIVATVIMTVRANNFIPIE